MAEFKDVIKQQKRMCDAMINCGQCPLIDADYACRFNCMVEGDFDSAETEIIERIVMDWAAANPEPRYPTWKEWHDTMFAESFVKEVPCPKFFLDQARGEILCAESEGCPDCWSNPIPADIADKLGIKPIGGGE